MTRFTTIEQMKQVAERSDDGVCRVWLSENECWLRVQYYRHDDVPSFYAAGFSVSEGEATDEFNRHVRSYGWVSGERRP